MQHNAQTAASRLSYLLLVLGAVLLSLAVALIWRYGGPGYFALTGRPWTLTGSKAAAPAPSNPAFATTQSVSEAQLAAGETQTITINATASAATAATIKAWVTSPKSKQVWRSPDDALTHFAAGQPVTATYHFALPAGSLPGVYQVSYLINSADENSDYVTKDRFAEFTLQ